MNILIVAATVNEVQPFLKNYSVLAEDADYYSFNFKNHQINILITGVGMLATTFRMTKLLCEKKFDLTINAGIAGCFIRSISLGTVLNITSDCFSEMGAENGNIFIPIEKLGFSNALSSSVLEVNYKYSTPFIETLKKVKGITVNTVSGNEDTISRIQNMFNPVAESMEGGAFIFVANQFKLPAIQLRSVSNYVEPRNLNHWKLDLSINNLNQTLIQIINELPG